MGGLAAGAQDIGEPHAQLDELLIRAVLDLARLHGLADRDERAIEELAGAGVVELFGRVVARRA